MISTLDGWDLDRRKVGVMLWWALWSCRNGMVWKQKGLEVNEVVRLATVVLSEWNDAQDKNFDRSWGLLQPGDEDQQLSLPMINKTKVFTNAMIFQASNSFSTAFAAQNHEGGLIEARFSCKLGNISPECIEAMGIREALSWTKVNQMEDVNNRTALLLSKLSEERLISCLTLVD